MTIKLKECPVVHPISPVITLAQWCSFVAAVKNKYVILVQRREAYKQPHGFNFHMKNSQVPDGNRAPVLQWVSDTQCMHVSMDVSKRSRKELEKADREQRPRGALPTLSRGEER